MKLTEEQKKRINEGIVDKILQWIVNREYWKAKKMFENDPQLQKKMKDVFNAMEKATKSLDDYCKKYGCVEPSQHTVKLKTFKEMRAEKSANSKKKK